MIGVDTSFLVEIRGATATMALSAQVLAEFCHVTTDPRRFERPSSMTDALDLCELWWPAAECRRVEVDAEVGSLFLTWMRTFRLGRKRLPDTLLAATCHRAGIRRLATTDWWDFEIFGVFEIERL